MAGPSVLVSPSLRVSPSRTDMSQLGGGSQSVASNSRPVSFVFQSISLAPRGRGSDQQLSVHRRIGRHDHG
jgi:hypothetical protein